MWTVADWVILVILIVYLLVLTFAANKFISLIPRADANANPVYVFIIAFTQLLIMAAIIYAFFNWVLTPLLGTGNISYATSIFYYIIIFVVAIFVISVMSPTRGAPLG